MFSTSDMYYFDDDELSIISRGSEESIMTSLVAASESQVSALRTYLQKKENPPVHDETQGLSDPKSENKLIARLQRELTRVGCNAGQPDGILGKQTISAVKRFAATANLKFKVDQADLADLVLIISQKPVGFCPQVPVPTQAALEGTWKTDAICPSQRLDGTIKLSKVKSAQGTVEYRAVYRFLGAQFEGWLRHVDDQINFSLSLVKGQYWGHKAITGSGNSRGDARPRLIYLSSSDGCTISALRR